MNNPIKFKWWQIIAPLVLGIIAGVAVNYKLTNYFVGFPVAILSFLVPSWILALYQKYNIKGVFLILCLQFTVFIFVFGLGIGLFYIKLNKAVVDIENRRVEIIDALKSDNPELSGIYFSKTLKDRMIDIYPCWSNDTIIYYNDHDYCIVIPITRPLFLSFSSFKVLTWESKKGWNMDKISWMLTNID